MKQLDRSSFDKAYSEYLNLVVTNSETIIVNGENNNGFVVMPLDRFNEIDETVYLLSSKANAERLNASIEEYKKGQYKKMDLIED